MAMEDAFALSRVLDRQGWSLGKACEMYESVRRPRVEEIRRRSVSNSDMRKRTWPWRLWWKETVLMVVIWVYNGLGLGRWGFRQGYMLYDIEKEI